MGGGGVINPTFVEVGFHRLHCAPSFISSHGANKGASRSLSDWLTAGTPASSAATDGRLCPGCTSATDCFQRGELSDGRWSSSLSVREERNEGKEETEGGGGGGVGEGRAEPGSLRPRFGEPKNDLQKWGGMRQRRRCS